MAAPAAAIDDLYRPRPGEVYSPPTYCNWNRTGLPAAYQKICAERDKKVGVYKPNWQSIEADNGAVYKVDLNSISPYTNGTVDVLTYAVEGSDFIPENLRRLWFDCRGHFQDQTGGIGPTQFAPPRSIAGEIGAIACARAQAATAAIDAESARRGRSPEEYCKGFSSDACDRMKSTIDTKQSPPYCRQGFALVGSGLSAEQLRICYVMTSPSFTAD